MIYKVILTIALLASSPIIVWVFYNMFKDFKFNKYFFVQRLKCWKCLTFWISLIVLLLFNGLFVSLAVASVLSFIAYKLDIKFNRGKDNEIKLW